MHLPVLITRALGWAAFEFARLQPFIPTYTHLVASAVFPIYAGAHASLSRPSSAARKRKRDIGNLNEEDEDQNEDDDPPPMEGLTAQDAILFPVLAGLTLTSLYFIIKWLQDPALLNKILNWYFAAFSVFSVSRLVSDGLDLLHSVLFPHDYIDSGVLFHVSPKARMAIPVTPSASARLTPLPGIFSRVPLPKSLTNFAWTLYILPNRRLQFEIFIRRILDVRFRLGIHGIEGLLVGLLTVLWYNFISKPWWLTNLMGFGFAYGTLQLMSPTTFWTGTLILSGLFFYDIYFVFYTPMMVTVAKSLDIPIKLLFPRPPEPDTDPRTPSMSMLGLGDIVLPGIMIGLALRFDLYRFYLRKQTKGMGASNSTSVHVDSNDQLDGTLRAQAAATSPGSAVVIKAPYQSVAEGWGDRLWTFSLSSGRSSRFGYVARNAFPKPYFHAALIGYVAGMLTTLGAMQVSNHAQPALLYLVPGVLSSLWGRAWSRGETKEMWGFSDAPEEKEETSDQSKSEEKEEDESSTVHKPASSKQTSFFSLERSEARSRRLEKAISRGSKSDAEKETREGSKTEVKEDDRNRGRFFRFSISVPETAKEKLSRLSKKEEVSAVESPRYSLKGKQKDLGNQAEKRQKLS